DLWLLTVACNVHRYPKDEGEAAKPTGPQSKDQESPRIDFKRSRPSSRSSADSASMPNMRCARIPSSARKATKKPISSPLPALMRSSNWRLKFLMGERRSGSSESAARIPDGGGRHLSISSTVTLKYSNGTDWLPSRSNFSSSVMLNFSINCSTSAFSSAVLLGKL